MSLLRLSLGVATLACTMAISAKAGLIGASVTGVMQVNGAGLNYFDPANTFVPASGFLNTSGTTVTIADPAVEFGYDDGSNRDTADFADSTLTLTDISLGTSSSITYTFTSAAFVGGTLTPISSDFQGQLTSSLVGDTITITTPAFSPRELTALAGTTYTANFNLGTSSVPEPQSIALMASGMGLCAFLARRRRNRQ